MSILKANIALFGHELKPSVIKPICTTIEKTLVLKTLGRLHNQDITTLDEALQTILGQ